MEINPSTIPGLILRLRSGQAPGVCSGLILSGAAYPDLKIGVCRRRSIKRIERERRGAKKIEMPQLLGTGRLKKRIAEIKKRKAGFYRGFKRI